MRSLSWLRPFALATVVALGGCAVLPSHVERAESHAIADGARTTLGSVAAASVPPGAAELSGFRLLPDGDDALEARLSLIRSAEKSIDVQYYLIANDDTGRQFLAALADAAARGVRVRVLVDDLYTAREDALFAALSAQPGFEVRLFNPLPARSGGFAARVALSAHEFARINHRMHNKLLIADDSFAITGGRNIADEYFDRGGADQLHRHGPAVVRPGRRRAGGAVRRVLELALRLSGAKPAARRSLPAQAASARRRCTALRADAARRRREPTTPRRTLARGRARARPGRSALRAAPASSPTRRRGSPTRTRPAATAR